MTKVLAGITTSVDGYVAGPDDGPGNGLGEGGERLHYWVFGGPWTYESEPRGEATGVDAERLAATFIDYRVRRAVTITPPRRRVRRPANAGRRGEDAVLHRDDARRLHRGRAQLARLALRGRARAGRRALVRGLLRGRGRDGDGRDDLPVGARPRGPARRSRQMARLLRGHALLG